MNPITKPSDIVPGTPPPCAWLTQAEWNTYGKADRATVWAAYFTDVLKVREVPKNSNDGLWVRWMLKLAGLAPGQPWCASFEFAVEWCAGNLPGNDVNHPGSVWGWAHCSGWKLTTTPKKGDLAFWLNGDHGHIMRFLSGNAISFKTIEGNAQPGVIGNQADGGGCYRRTRLRTKKIKFLTRVKP